MNTLQTILYFSIFKFPLNKEEIFNFATLSKKEIEQELQILLQEKKIYTINGYYLPINNKEWVQKKIAGKAMATLKMKKAIKNAKLLSQFPFVQAVMISGTLAKGYMDTNSDIDYFVITKPGNIVISKFLMGLYRRLFAQESFCVNFILDWNNLKIKKENIYAAVEVVTLIPIINKAVCQKFIEVNKSWVDATLPNATLNTGETFPLKNSTIKKGLEKLFSTTFFLKTGRVLQKQYLKKLSKGEKVKTLKTEELQIEDGVFKGHNLSYQSKVLSLFDTYQKEVATKGYFDVKQHFYD